MEELNAVEKVRSRYEAEILTVPGVVAVSLGLDGEGKACLKIGTSRPVEDVRPLLPGEIFEVSVELEYFGEIEAQ